MHASQCSKACSLPHDAAGPAWARLRGRALCGAPEEHGAPHRLPTRSSCAECRVHRIRAPSWGASTSGPGIYITTRKFGMLPVMSARKFYNHKFIYSKLFLSSYHMTRTRTRTRTRILLTEISIQSLYFREVPTLHLQIW